ncbi:hypothetical protein RhiirA1_451404 [Rhizophagus irregularis]|uniref:Uncharacterized protein n=1 Tax=Rhizophagus irregularis TaxID=588596 RepID=A0A2N0SCG5_9GLOM|nr:hypothetical protein RhiirA1_451404 [Rhizophagus irregularis]GET58028.1 hypothetical protein RIR_e51392_A0A2N0SCG5_9GLOM [Rhizophagus irregularis DAOM 181602=DAOM 197198]
MSGRKIKIYLQEDLHKQSFSFGSKVLKLSFILRPASISENLFLFFILYIGCSSSGYQLRFGWTSLNYWTSWIGSVPAPSWTRLLGWISASPFLDWTS